MATDPATEDAPAKINLCLHVTGRRADGYHLLDSLVVFAGACDRVSLTDGQPPGLSLTGPEAAALTVDPDNLVLRAARLMGLPVSLELWKALPVASGIGGGSADAAATLRLLARQFGHPLPPPASVLALGADVPVCLAGTPLRMRGVGEDLKPLPALPPLWLVLVNPRIPVSTPQVFAALTRRDNPPVPDLPGPALRSATALAGWLAEQTGNHLAAPAQAIVPQLDRVQSALAATHGCLLARMSGSGATHFGLFASKDAAQRAARVLAGAHPGWWIVPTSVRGPATGPADPAGQSLTNS